jgi:hypothetical protein
MSLACQCKLCDIAITVCSAFTVCSHMCVNSEGTGHLHDVVPPVDLPLVLVGLVQK